MVFFHSYWPIIDNALRAAAIDNRVSIKLLISYWKHSKPSEDFFLRSLDAISNSYPNVDIQIVNHTAFEMNCRFKTNNEPNSHFRNVSSCQQPRIKRKFHLLVWITTSIWWPIKWHTLVHRIGQVIILLTQLALDWYSKIPKIIEMNRHKQFEVTWQVCSNAIGIVYMPVNLSNFKMHFHLNYFWFGIIYDLSEKKIWLNKLYIMWFEMFSLFVS